MRITNKQQNQLSEIFRTHKLKYSDFIKTGIYKEFKLKYKYEYFSFYISKQESAFDYHINYYSIDNTKPHILDVKWDDLLNKFGDWCKSLSQELNIPTGWESLESENYLNSKYSEINESFTENDKIIIRLAVKELKERISSIVLEDDQLEIIKNKLDELTLKVDKYNKFDWKSLFMGTMANLLMTLSIPQEAAGMIWEFIKISFSGLHLLK